MTKRELIADMQKSVGVGQGLITMSGIQKYFGVKSHHTVARYVRGLERINGKYYFIPDVAESMLRTGGVR